ncbi:helix-turn-helix domain-containing protein [Halomarina rubra]|uniref:Helix-turn-helix domain-containing protein n=1 Tax=Halomarina rubra TaxID=2071873 RepID=A0ABD6AW41_9EURY|nr:helix-turn-helix domain-containing protein [Halomarina rubra]
MDEKTAELRDIFIDVTDGETVTERQEDGRGSLTEDEDRIDERLNDIVARMREQFEFASDRSPADLRRVVRGYYDGEDDTTIADALGVERRVVVQARHDLHLLRDRETDSPFEFDRLRELRNDERDRSAGEMADELGVSESTLRKYSAVVDTQNAKRSVNGRFTDEFAELLTDADLQDHTESVEDDGLEEATEGMETDVSF